MTLGLLGAGPLQMLFSLLLMQGLSLTMWRTFLQQAIPRFDPMRFQVSIGNDPNKQGATSTPAPNMENLLPFLNVLAPMILQQQMHRQQNLQQVHSLLVPNSQQSATPQVMSAPLMTGQTFQIPSNGHQIPQVIIVPQVVPQQSSSKSSASTNFAVQVDPPEKEREEEYGMPSHITRRMLERPPKTTTRRPKIVNRAHAGAMHVQFVTPKTPAGLRRHVIPAVTARVLFDSETTVSVTTEAYVKPIDSYDNNFFVSTQSSKPERNVNHKYDEETTTSSPKEEMIELSSDLDNVLTTTLSPVTTTSTDGKTNETTVPQVLDKNLLNHKMNDTKNAKNSTEEVLSMNQLIDSEFIKHVKNLSLNQIDSNQSPDIYFENSKGGQLNDTENYHLLDNSL